MTYWRKIFVDVGGHEGQTVRMALEPKFEFEEVHTFEPHPVYAEKLRQIRDPRVVVHEAALSDHDGRLHLSGDNNHGGATVAVRVPGAEQRDVACVDVVRFINGIGPQARIFMKINCEGGEVAIVDRLTQIVAPSTLVALIVDYDVVKLRFGYWAKRRSLAAARLAGLPIVLSEAVVVKEHGGLRNWLYGYPQHFSLDAADVPRQPLLKRRIRYAIRDIRSACGLRVSWNH